MPRSQVRQQSGTASSLAQRFATVRELSEALVAPLSEADATLQSMQDASPAKWHLAHTNWFWETFLLRDHLPGYVLYNATWPFVFNSYYETEGERIAREARGMLSRPTLEEILAWRAHVNEAIDPLFRRDELQPLFELGMAHEQQHQELLLTDIKHALFQNPLGPAMWNELTPEEYGVPVNPGSDDVWYSHPGGIAHIGHQSDSFAFDNETPAHRVLLEPFALCRDLVTNRQWAEFIADGGYDTATLWLSDGWAWACEQAISAPLYWREDQHFTHCGWQYRNPDAPVTHISYFEADAFATWAGLRLPTEFEWEAIARGQRGDASAHDPSGGNQLDRAAPPLPQRSMGLFGDCWQFTRSAYLPYPRFRPPEGAIGEYNGKFMSGQSVLKGASCATPRGHSRASYRNFFYPRQRWQFTGLRLAREV